MTSKPADQGNRAKSFFTTKITKDTKEEAKEKIYSLREVYILPLLLNFVPFVLFVVKCFTFGWTGGSTDVRPISVDG